jgi:hypothetical protein
MQKAMFRKKQEMQMRHCFGETVGKGLLDRLL